VRADLTALSTKATGVVATIVVSDFQPVKSGDLLVQLRDDAFRAQSAGRLKPPLLPAKMR